MLANIRRQLGGCQRASGREPPAFRPQGFRRASLWPVILARRTLPRPGARVSQSGLDTRQAALCSIRRTRIPFISLMLRASCGLLPKGPELESELRKGLRGFHNAARGHPARLHSLHSAPRACADNSACDSETRRGTIGGGGEFARPATQQSRNQATRPLIPHFPPKKRRISRRKPWRKGLCPMEDSLPGASRIICPCACEACATV
jgi:hypothetical protein